jgi:putative cell wall-binding protein
MAKKFLRSLLVIVFILLLSVGHDNLAKAEGETEPNGSLQTATPIQLNTSYSGLITNTSDEDYFKFTLSKAGNVTISVDRSVDQSWLVEVMDKDGNEFTDFYTSSSNSSNGTEDVEIGLDKGEYYVKITSYSWESVNYHFQVKFEESNYFEKEHNDTLKTSTPVELNKAYKGNIQDYYPGDEDWYTYKLEKPGNVTIKMDRVVGSSWFIEVVNQEGKRLTQEYTKYDSKAIGQEEFEIGLPAGQYYIHISDYTDTERVPYTFTVGFLQSDLFEKEFNNSLTSANKINLNKTYTGIIQDGVFDEVDFYSFSLAKPGFVTFEMDRKPGVRWYIEIMNENGESLSGTYTEYDTDVTGKETMKIGLPVGNYYIKVSENISAEGVPYTFGVKYEQGEFLEREVNNDAQSSTPIVLNQVYKGVIQNDVNDLDYYSFTLSKPENILLSMKQQANITWRIELFDQEGNQIDYFYTDDENLSNSVEQKEMSLAKGIYFIKVTNYYSASNIPYSFKVQQKTQRIKGTSRYETAIEISKQGWITSDTVVLAKGNDFPDALAGGPLAYYHNAPILLTDGKALTPVTKKEISRLKAKKVIILGSEGAISKAVENELKNSGISIQRIGGKDRYDTAAKIAKEIPASKVIIASGKNFPDALAVAPYASRNKFPILLTAKDTLPSSTKAALAGMNSSIIVGSTGVVSDAVKKQLPNPVRYGGKDRYETAKLINENLPLGKEIGYVATGSNFPDALSGSVLAAKNNTSILLVNTKSIPAPTKSILKGFKQYKVWGGTGAVSEDVLKELDSVLAQID